SPTAHADRAVRAFVRQLRHSGVGHVVIAPGSRSTPLTLAFARDPEFTALLHLDERSAGYFALGLARQLRAPVALVCTSGTAAAGCRPSLARSQRAPAPGLPRAPRSDRLRPRSIRPAGGSDHGSGDGARLAGARRPALGPARGEASPRPYRRDL